MITKYPLYLTLRNDVPGGDGTCVTSLAAQDVVTLKGIALVTQVTAVPYVALALDPPGVCFIGADMQKATQCMMRYKLRLQQLWVEQGSPEHLDLSLSALCCIWALEIEREASSSYLLLQETTDPYGTLGAYSTQHLAACFLLLFRQIALAVTVQTVSTPMPPGYKPGYRPNTQWN